MAQIIHSFKPLKYKIYSKKLAIIASPQPVVSSCPIHRRRHPCPHCHPLFPVSLRCCPHPLHCCRSTHYPPHEQLLVRLGGGGVHHLSSLLLSLRLFIVVTTVSHRSLPFPLPRRPRAASSSPRPLLCRLPVLVAVRHATPLLLVSVLLVSCVVVPPVVVVTPSHC